MEGFNKFVNKVDGWSLNCGANKMGGGIYFSSVYAVKWGNRF